MAGPRLPRIQHVCHGIAHGDEVYPLFLLLVGDMQGADGVGAHADDGRDGLRTREEAGGDGCVIVHYLGAGKRHHQTEHAHHAREDDLLDALSADGRDELRSALIADGKQEDKEEQRLEGSTDGNVHLPDDHTDQKDRGDRAERECLVLQLADQEAETDCQEYRNGWICPERL